MAAASMMQPSQLLVAQPVSGLMAFNSLQMMVPFFFWNASTIVFDKTGTLTKGAFYVSDINPVGMSKASLVEIVAHLENYSLHPIAKSIVDHYDDDINKDLVKETKGVPFIMPFTCGEYVYDEHSANMCGGLMLSFTIFGKE